MVNRGIMETMENRGKNMRRTTLPGQEEALALSLRALAFILRDDARKERFLALTGVDAEALRAAAGEPALGMAVLDHLLADETALMLFAAEEGLDPALPRLARMRLGAEDI